MRETQGTGSDRRFKPNRIVRTILDLGKFSLDDVWKMYMGELFSTDEMYEFYQLIGYSIESYEELFEFAEVPPEETIAGTDTDETEA